MIFIRDKLTYEEVKHRFEREGYSLLSTEYKNAKSSLNVLCPRGHEWVTNISNFDSDRRCSVCSRRKKHSLEEVKRIFVKEGYRVLDSMFINGKTPIKVTCPNGHDTEVNMNNFLNGRRCSLCNRIKAAEAKKKKLEMKLTIKETAPRREVETPSVISDRAINESARQANPEWLEKLDEMRRNLKLRKKCTYRQ